MALSFIEDRIKAFSEKISIILLEGLENIENIF